MPVAIGDELLILDGAFGLTDKSGNSNIASYNGGMGVVYDSTAGRNVYSFDGVNDFISLGTAVRTSTPVTMTAWIKANSVGIGVIGSIVAISKSDSSNHYWLLRQNTPALLEARSRAGGTGAGGTTTSLTTSWTHVIGEFSSSTSRTSFINGTAGTTNTTSRSPTGMDVLTIGYGYGTDNGYFAGLITDVRIFNRNLTAGERTTLGASIGYTSPLTQSRRRRFSTGLYGL